MNFQEPYTATEKEVATIRNAKFRILYAGEWCRVTGLYNGPLEVDDPRRASSAVLFWASHRCWVAIEVTPGEIFGLHGTVQDALTSWESVPADEDPPRKLAS
jgi:hypothetical protein